MDADLADMQLISKFNKEIRFSLFVIDSFSKYTLVLWKLVLWIIKEGITITKLDELDESKHKSNRMWVKEENFTIDQWNHG